MKLKRIDPKGCGCTDCIIGYSKPIDLCSDEELKKLYLGLIYNASDCELKVVYEAVE